MQGFVAEKVTKILGLTAIVTTLAITPTLSMEPINWIKLLTLSVGVSIAFGIFLVSKNAFVEKSSKLPNFLLFTLALVSSASWAYRGFPLTQFWGVSGRATGLLAYLMLIGACWLSFRSIRFGNVIIFLRMFIICGLLVLVYMSLQFFGFDFFEWTRLETFATLGNINFSSAFIGMWLSAITLLMVSVCKKKRILSFLVFLIILWSIYLLTTSGSVQGLVSYLFSMAFLGITRTFAKLGLVKLSWAGISSLFVAFAIFIFGTTQKTFANGLLFQETMAFRRDYWVAALRMLKESPIIGLGFDSYGSYYRSVRDEIAANRTSLQRVSDSAHSIFLDVSVSAGVMASLLLLCLVILASVNSLRVLSRRETSSLTYAALIWLAYLPQLVFGINQLGVGVWAWIFLGQLLAIPVQSTKANEVITNHDDLLCVGAKVTKKPPRANQLTAKQFLSSISTGSAALVLALPPFLADARFYTAYQQGDLISMTSASKLIGSSQYLSERALEFASQGTDGALVLQMAEDTVQRFPRSFYAWTTIYDLKATSTERRIEAKEEIRELDPYLYKSEGLDKT